LRSEGSEAAETKQATHQPLTAKCDVTGIFFIVNSKSLINWLSLL
jgi:hypothetical protein